MSDWIVDRLPTRADADGCSLVLAWYVSGVGATYYRNVMPGQAWMPFPPPYTGHKNGLAASIERLERWHTLDFDPNKAQLVVDLDLAEVIKAAKKWNQFQIDMDAIDANPSHRYSPLTVQQDKDNDSGRVEQ
jgi:hypothetical protein